jgi:serine/threonine protein kinase
MNSQRQQRAQAPEAVKSRLRAQLRAIFGRRCRPKLPFHFPKNVSHYELLKEIGVGARGTVYLARERRSNQVVAIKILRRSTDREARLRFLREAACASAIAHPNVVRLYELILDREVAAIAMEYIPGKTLDCAIRRRGLPLKTCLDYALQIAKALAAIHSASMVHRDVKPANFVVTKDRRIKLLDFGLAKIIGWQRPSSRSYLSALETRDGTILGTPAYMSPEQALGQAADQRSDIFSFGILFYEMLTGHPAFRKNSEIEAMGAILHKAPHKLPARIPAPVRRIVRRCLEKDPTRRYQAAEELIAALTLAAKVAVH